MSLMQLSTELLLLVTSNLSQVDLLNVSMTSKSSHETTEPALYREYHPPSLRRRSISLFIRALLKDSRRQRYVHSLRLPEWEILDPQNEENKFEPDSVQEAAVADGMRIYHSMSYEWNPNKEPGHGLTLDDYKLFTSAALATGLVRDVVSYGERGAVVFRGVEKSYDAYCGTLYYWYYFSTTDLESLPFHEKFCHLLRAGVDDAYIVLLGSLLKNLRRMSLRGVPPTLNKLPWTRVLQRYSRLREFTAIPASHYQYGVCPLSFWVDVLTLPTLELFTGDGCASWSTRDYRIYARSRFSLSPHTLNLRRLVLGRCELDYGDLKLVLGACQDLKAFQYSSEWREGTATSAQILDLLAPFHITLEELFLNKDSAAFRKGSHPADRFQDQPLRSLAQFTRLERLWIPTNMWANLPSAWEEYRDPSTKITLAGLLPPSLKEFTFMDSHAYPILTQPVLDDLLEVASFELRELTRLEVVSKHNHSKESNILEQEKEMQRDSGSTFIYRFRWSHTCSFQLPKIAEELKLHLSHKVGATCWDIDHYATRPWQSLKTPNILSREEEEAKEYEDVLAILAEIEDAPTCNDEICELLQQGAYEVAMRLQVDQDMCCF